MGSRRPVFSGTRRVPGLYERTLADGRAVWEVRQRLEGRLRRVRLQASTKTDAIMEQRALVVDADRGALRKSPGLAVTLDELAALWLAQLESRTSHRDPRLRRSPRTVAVARQRLASWILPEFGRRPVDEVSVRDVRGLIGRMVEAGRAPSTISGTVYVLSGLLRYAVKHGYAERNVVRDLDRDDRPGTRRLSEPRYLTGEQIALLLAHLTDVFRPLAGSCAYAGLRVSEALGLRWSDVDFATDTLSVTGQLGANGQRQPVKSPASAATVPLLPVLKRLLLAHRRRQGARDLSLVRGERLVFVTGSGEAQSRRNALRAVHVAGDNAGLNPDGREKVGLHDLRHSFVALALEHGLTLPEAALLARHANARVTAVVYAGVADGARERIARKLVRAGLGV